MASPHITNGVYTRLKQSILSARINTGSVLGEREIAEEQRVSRTPVREALVRLMADELLLRLSGRGYLVPAISAKEAADLYVVREALEAAAINLANPLMTADVCRRLETAVEDRARARSSTEGTRASHPRLSRSRSNCSQFQKSDPLRNLA
jgi:DNA-binding GntR family transcriptional regulator